MLSKIARICKVTRIFCKANGALDDTNAYYFNHCFGKILARLSVSGRYGDEKAYLGRWRQELGDRNLHLKTR